MRRIVLGLALASTALASPALARDKSWYVEGDAGAVLAQDETYLVHATSAQVFSENYKAGYDVDGKIGYDFGKFRLEGETGYRRNKASSLISTTQTLTAYQSHTSALSFMANALLDFGPDDGLQGFVGGGAGVARVTSHANTNLYTIRDSSSGFAWQILAGLRQPLTSHLDVGLTYRYFD